MAIFSNGGIEIDVHYRDNKRPNSSDLDIMRMPTRPLYTVGDKLSIDDSKLNNKSNWYSNTKDISYMFHTVDNIKDVNSDKTLNAIVQYGMNLQPYASARFFSLELGKIVVEDLGKSKYRVKMVSTIKKITSRQTDLSTGVGVAVRYNIYLNNKLKLNRTLTSVDAITMNDVSEFIDVTLEPEQLSYLASIRINVDYPNGEFNASDIYIGYTIKNLRKKNYKPFGFLVNGKLVSFNDVESTEIILNGKNIALHDEKDIGKIGAGNIQYLEKKELKQLGITKSQ